MLTIARDPSGEIRLPPRRPVGAPLAGSAERVVPSRAIQIRRLSGGPVSEPWMTARAPRLDTANIPVAVFCAPLTDRSPLCITPPIATTASPVTSARDVSNGTIMSAPSCMNTS
jgi:hypothetical protein